MKTKKEKQGVSLIVLVITIIVMVILAGSIILTLNNSGIINKASDAVEKTNLKQVQQIASLAWAEAYTDGVRTVEDVDGVKGFQTRIDEALEAQGINLDDYTITVTTNGVIVELLEDEEEATTPVLDPTLNPTGVIPEGATYTTGYVWTTDSNGYEAIDTSGLVTYTAGQNFPDTPQALDRYVYEDYVYVYNAIWYAPPNSETWADYQWAEGDYEGWLVATATGENKTSYGVILESVNEKPIMSMNSTFYTNTILETSPVIPSTVTDMGDTFYGCVALTSAPVIPSDVTNMWNTFYGCTALTGSITINATPTKYSDCLKSTQVTEILGDCGIKSDILATK